MKKLVLALALLLAPAMAAGNDFLASLHEHPAAKAASLSLTAARQEALGSANYFSFDANGGFASRELAAADPCPYLADPDPSNDVFCQILYPEIPETSSQSEIGLTLRPFAYGDVADYQRNSWISYRLASIDYQSSLTRLEKGALEAAMQYYLARRGRQLASVGLDVARKAYQATLVRYRKGAASERDLRQAKLALAEAENESKNAASSLRLAEQALRYFSSVPPPPWPWPSLDPPADAVPPAVAKARLRLEQALIGLERSQRAFVPVAEIRYQHNLDDSSAIGVSLETRTLGTRVYYAYQSYADPTRKRTENELRLGLRLNFNQSDWGGLEAARSRLAAAEAALTAAKEQSQLDLARLELQIEKGRRQLQLAKASLEAAERDYLETQKRVELGLAVPLEEQSAWLRYSRAQLELLQAEQAVIRDQLDVLAYLGVPPSEVWK